ncbi:acyltransferase [Vibrio salinus]|uniref:acyltransferase n=1 Tax=Vibrio salinus TaxID=2899784 RepID=UPI0027E2297B|nr:acyltransferase [Vibrio salinus]
MLKHLMRYVKDFIQIQLRQKLLSYKVKYLNAVYGMHIHPSARISLKAKLDKRNGQGIYIGEGSYIAFEAKLLAHDMCRRKTSKVVVGKNCHIGCNTLILPDVEIGDSCIVAAGAVVTKSVPSNCLVAGNPAVIKKRGIHLGYLGILPPVQEIPADTVPQSDSDVMMKSENRL